MFLRYDDELRSMAHTDKVIVMNLKRIIGTGAIAGALGFSAIGLAGGASAAPAPAPGPGVVQHAQLVHWGGGGRGPGWGGRGFGGRGWGGPGFRPGWGGPGPIGWGGPPPCLIGLCI
jgi:hypothetical protein